ncbi:MAG: SGNH/GDSL hydrolase family protein [Alphaproteobacteria bacterium]|nr:SGNH/GDSL hydrolase family protein [Alphaproteobacteria bacterium]
MLVNLGRGLSPLKSASTPPVQLDAALALTSSLPAGTTYTRADSVATRRNASGKLEAVSANTPRFDFDTQGNALGILMEGAVTNKCTNTNVNPTATTNITKAGDAAANFTVVDDATALAAAGLDALCTNGMAFKLDNSAGTSTAWVDIGGQTGNLNPHTFSVWARGNSGTIGALTRSGTGANSVNMAGAQPYQRYILANETPNITAVQMRIRANAGKIVWFVLNQLEEMPFATSEIIISGAAATRAADRLVYALSGKTWFNVAQGYIGLRYRPKGFMPSTFQYLLVADNGASSNDTIGFRLNTSTNDLGAYVRAGGASQNANSNNDAHIAGCMNSAGMTWQAGQAIMLSGGKANTKTYASNPSGITSLNIGSRTSGADPFFGHITKVVIGALSKTAAGLGAKLHEATDIAVIGGGQSLVRGYFSSNQSGSEAGKQKFREVLGLAHPRKVVTFVDGATGGSASTSTTDSINYWWDLGAGTRGPAFNTFYSNIAAAGLTPTAVLFELGETDSGGIKNALTTRAQYKSAMQAIFNDIRASFGDIPILLQKIGRRTGFEFSGAVQVVRDVQEELIDELAYVHRGTETYDQTLFDEVHPNDAGFVAMAERNARKMASMFGAALSGVEGPIISGWSRSGTTVTVTLSHDGGSDFTPTTGIEGFHFFDGTTEIAVTAAVRASATSLTLTLASAPSGPSQTLTYIYDEEATLTPSNTLRDNAVPPMPLKARFITH